MSNSFDRPCVGTFVRPFGRTLFSCVECVTFSFQKHIDCLLYHLPQLWFFLTFLDSLQLNSMKGSQLIFKDIESVSNSPSLSLSYTRTSVLLYVFFTSLFFSPIAETSLEEGMLNPFISNISDFFPFLPVNRVGSGFLIDKFG